jgi:hypothetical protein
MKQLRCIIAGHQMYSPEVLATEPWNDPDFAGYAREDFREPNCLRCGQPLAEAA